MNETSSNRNAPMNRYAELLLMRNDLRKECRLLEMEYTRVFGQDIIGIVQLKLECLKKRSVIGFCRSALNRGEVPVKAECAAFVGHRSRAMREQLEGMTRELIEIGACGTVTKAELLMIKTVYRRIVRRIHPDLLPRARDSRALTDLFAEVTDAYERNDLNALRELEVLAAGEAEAAGCEAEWVDVPEIGVKIAALEEEIAHILSTDPYQYKTLLEDEEAVRAKHGELEEQKKIWSIYGEQLDALLAQTGAGEWSELWARN